MIEAMDGAANVRFRDWSYDGPGEAPRRATMRVFW